MFTSSLGGKPISNDEKTKTCRNKRKKIRKVEKITNSPKWNHSLL